MGGGKREGQYSSGNGGWRGGGSNHRERVWRRAQVPEQVTGRLGVAKPLPQDGCEVTLSSRGRAVSTLAGREDVRTGLCVQWIWDREASLGSRCSSLAETTDRQLWHPCCAGD